MTAENNFVLTLQCQDRKGIVAAVGRYLAEAQCNIVESAQHQEPGSRRFYMRSAFRCEGHSTLASLREGFSAVAEAFEMDWSMRSRTAPMKTVLAVSKSGHCMDALLSGAKRGTIPVDVVAVVSNHLEMESLAAWYGVPYLHLPVSSENKREQEMRLLGLMESEEAELLVLARYMQVLTSDACALLQGRAINIHHSFLPGFKGARPYHQAYEKGVKLIGATAHYVTADLDEGPIIEQETVRVSHADSPAALVETGRAVEASVLCRAVKWHAENRVLPAGSRTVVFDR
jgi:formyltetrahydrofolate deformylase